jgi:hypothetical protein
MQALKRTRVRPLLAVTAVVILSLSGCSGELVAPESPIEADRHIVKPGAEGFYDQIVSACGHHPLGGRSLDYLIKRRNGEANDYFLDVTSKLYYGHIDRTTYAKAINSFFKVVETTMTAQEQKRRADVLAELASGTAFGDEMLYSLYDSGTLRAYLDPSSTGTNTNALNCIYVQLDQAHPRRS